MWPNSRFIRVCRGAGQVLAALALSACSTLSSVPDVTLPARDSLTAFALEGRFSLRHESQNYSGRLSWRHEGQSNTLLLASPFGQGLAEITTSEQGAKLTTSDGTSHVAADAETLTRQFLGYPLPLEQLADWVRARDSGGEFESRDALGRPLRLRRDGWRIDYDYGSSELPQALPERIFAERVEVSEVGGGSEGGFELRLRIDEWSRLTPGEGTP